MYCVHAAVAVFGARVNVRSPGTRARDVPRRKVFGTFFSRSRGACGTAWGPVAVGKEGWAGRSEPRVASVVSSSLSSRNRFRSSRRAGVTMTTAARDCIVVIVVDDKVAIVSAAMSSLTRGDGGAFVAARARTNRIALCYVLYSWRVISKNLTDLCVYMYMYVHTGCLGITNNFWSIQYFHVFFFKINTVRHPC